MIVLPECPVDEAQQVLERVRERLAERIVIAELPRFTISFGLASSEQAGDFDQVVSLADAALLSAKAGGRDRSSFQPGPTRPRRPLLPSGTGPAPDELISNGDSARRSPPREPQRS